MIVVVAILLGVSAVVHVQGPAAHGVEGAAAHVSHASEGVRSTFSWSMPLVGFIQLVLLVVVLVLPRRPVLWMGAWSSAATATLDALTVDTTIRQALVAAEALIVVLFLVLVEARARGRPVLGLRDVSGP